MFLDDRQLPQARPGATFLRIVGMLFLYAAVGFTGVSGQSQYPADSLLSSKEVPFFRKIGILPIAGWQRLSYNSNSLNCQYTPCCSFYAAQAISERGLILGSFMASDRIIRCNPTALESHLLRGGKLTPIEKRLIDPVYLTAPVQASTKSPTLAALFSAVLPGSGRVYAGHIHDGVTGFMLFALFTTLTIHAYDENYAVAAPILAGFTFVLYGGEVYGAYRSAKYYQTAGNP